MIIFKSNLELEVGTTCAVTFQIVDKRNFIKYLILSSQLMYNFGPIEFSAFILVNSLACILKDGMSLRHSVDLKEVLMFPHYLLGEGLEFDTSTIWFLSLWWFR